MSSQIHIAGIFGTTSIEELGFMTWTGPAQWGPLWPRLSLPPQDDRNVIVVGWDGGSQNIWYPQSASDTRAVGAEIGLVAQNVIANAGAAKERMWCSGHSLGSHICGHAGAYSKSFGRITGVWASNTRLSSERLWIEVGALFIWLNHIHQMDASKNYVCTKT